MGHSPFVIGLLMTKYSSGSVAIRGVHGEKH